MFTTLRVGKNEWALVNKIAGCYQFLKIIPCLITINKITCYKALVSSMFLLWKNMKYLFLYKYCIIKFVYVEVISIVVEEIICHTLRKVSIFEVFLIHVFSHLDWIWRLAEQIFVFNPNVGKYWPEKLRIQTLLCSDNDFECDSIIFHKQKSNLQNITTWTLPLSKVAFRFQTLVSGSKEIVQIKYRS